MKSGINKNNKECALLIKRIIENLVIGHASRVLEVSNLSEDLGCFDALKKRGANTTLCCKKTLCLIKRKKFDGAVVLRGFKNIKNAGLYDFILIVGKRKFLEKHLTAAAQNLDEGGALVLISNKKYALSLAARRDIEDIGLLVSTEYLDDCFSFAVVGAEERL